MRVAFDAVVFTQSRAGSARVARGLLDALPVVAPEIEIVRLGSGGFAGRGSARQKLAALRQDLAWYGDGLARAARRAGADLLHCPTFRAPLRRPACRSSRPCTTSPCCASRAGSPPGAAATAAA